MVGVSLASPLSLELIKAILEAEQITLFAIEPFIPSDSPEKPPNYLIRGQINLPNEKNQWVLETLQNAMINWNGALAACFHPRHQIEVVHSNTVWDIVICFSCSYVHIYRNKHFHSETLMAGPEPFTKILAEHGISIAA